MRGWDKSAITLAVFLPTFGALVIAFVPRSMDRLVRALGILFSGAALLVGILMLFGFDYVTIRFAKHAAEFGSRLLPLSAGESF